MDPRRLFSDERLRGSCTYCGARSSTRDHVPSRVLLDEPFPEALPVVEACAKCNVGCSLDEEYLACLIDCVVNGSVDPERLGRPKIARILRAKPALAALISASRPSDVLTSDWRIDAGRVRRVVLKLARGHLTYEFSEKYLHSPASFGFVPMSLLTDAQRESFETRSSGPTMWPEIGSRAFIRAATTFPPTGGIWTVIQTGRYRYCVDAGSTSVRMVLSEYLAAEVSWE